MPTLGCSVCFLGVPEDPMNISLSAAILLMLGVLALIFGFFIKFFIGINKRSKLTL